MVFLYGFLGGLAVLGLLAAGTLLGWKAHKAFTLYRMPKTEAPEQEELRRLKESQVAFRQMANYSMETAYGMGASQTGGDK